MLPITSMFLSLFALCLSAPGVRANDSIGLARFVWCLLYRRQELGDYCRRSPPSPTVPPHAPLAGRSVVPHVRRL